MFCFLNFKLYLCVSPNFVSGITFQFWECLKLEAKRQQQIKMLWIVFVFKFITSLRFPKNVPVTDVIRRRYGHPALRSVRHWERIWRRLEKNRQDLFFLKRCAQYDCTPTFLRFQLYNRTLENHHFYRNWQKELLHKEITTKENAIENLEK